MALFPNLKKILKSDTEEAKGPAPEELLTSEGEVSQAALAAYSNTLEIPEEILEKCTFSQLAEVVRLFLRSRLEKKQPESEEDRKVLAEKLKVINTDMAKKILSADEIWCIFNKRTGEPHMYTRIIDRGNGSYTVAAPYIYIAAKQAENAEMAMLNPDIFEVKRIENGENRTGIRNFFADCFYANGAHECAVLSETVRIPGEMLAPKPDFTRMKPEARPVLNPDLERWILLLGQLAKPADKEPDLSYRVIYNLLLQQIPKARLLVPVTYEGKRPVKTGGKITMPKGTKLKMPTINGREDRTALRCFTDIRKLRMAYDGSWDVMVQTVKDITARFDCAVNVSALAGSGIYITKELMESTSKAKKEGE